MIGERLFLFYIHQESFSCHFDVEPSLRMMYDE
jgi:hypothetical protein